jgi:hypothetical protein
MEKRAWRLWLVQTFEKLLISFHIYQTVNEICNMPSPEDIEMNNTVYAFKKLIVQ